MANDYDFHVKPIDRHKGFGEQQKQGGKKKRRKPDNHSEAKYHLKDLALTVKRVNGLLTDKKSPYRFSIKQKQNEIFIHLIVLDKQGNPQKNIKEDITHQEFSKIIEQIEKLDGFLVDYTV